MRVRGNVEPRSLDIEAHPQLTQFVVVRLRENIEQFTETDSQSGVDVSGYEYDEYSLTVKYYDNLQHDIESDMDNWLSTGRTLEFNENSSTVQLMKKALNILGVETDET